MQQIINILHSKILKLYNTTVFIALKKTGLPKCVIKHIIVRFCNAEPIQYMQMCDLKPKNFSVGVTHDYSNDFFKYPVYYPGRKYYAKQYRIPEKCLLIDNYERNLKNIFISQKFSAHHCLLVFKLEPTASDEYILAVAYIIANAHPLQQELRLPLFGEHFTDILKNNTNTLTDVVCAEMTLIKIESEKKRLTTIVALI